MNFHKKISCSLFALMLGLILLPAQNEFDVLKSTNGGNAVWEAYKEAPLYMYNHLSQQAFDLLDERATKIKAIQSLNDWKKRQMEIREKLNRIIGPFPEKTPLHARITRTIEKEGYKVEHVIFESFPGFQVTASLFIPEGLQDKAPAILYCSGHSAIGYRVAVYQHQILNLVKKGFVVFAFDPLGQGERLQYYNRVSKKSEVGSPTKEHSYVGTQVFVNGSSVAKYFVWDGIRAIDYLVTRKEVDPTRLGITGRSGGGTQSAFIAAMDDRIYAAAPECYITNYRRILESIGPQDGEQNPYHFLAEGLDHADYLTVRAPKPTIVITTTNDFFSIQGAMETEKEVKRAYQAFGAPENFLRIEDFGRHENTQKNREAMYAFFQEHLKHPGIVTDEEVDFLTEADLQVTPTGQLATSFESETVFSLNKKETEKYVAQLNQSRQHLATHLSKVMQAASTFSAYNPPTKVEAPMLTGKYQKEGYVIEKYVVRGGGDYWVPYVLYVPDAPVSKVLLYIHPNGKKADAQSLQEMEWFAQNGSAVLAPDLLGTGETFPSDFRGDAFINGVSLNIWYSAILVNKSIVGTRAADISRLSSLLERRFSDRDIYALAKGEMAPVLLHTAVLDERIQRIALIEPCLSYSSIAMEQFYDLKYIYNLVPGAIQKYDLADLEACLAPKKLMLLNSNNGAGIRLSTAAIQKELSIVKKAYEAQQASGQLMIEQAVVEGALLDLYTKWME